LLKQGELERARRMLARGDDPQAVLEALANSLTGKFLHGPTTLLQQPGPAQQQIGALIDRLLPEDKSS
jgi:glutamyl-tRNA reductase